MPMGILNLTIHFTAPASFLTLDYKLYEKTAMFWDYFRSPPGSQAHVDSRKQTANLFKPM